MKKIVTLVIAALISANAFAQISVGAGYMGSLTREKLDGIKKMRTLNANGAYLGAGYTIALRNDWALTPGLYYSFASSNETWMKGLAESNGRLNEHYVTIPVHFSKSWDDFFVYMGPSLEIGLSSIYTDKTSIIGHTVVETKFNYYDGHHDYSRFNVMLGIGIGYDITDSIRITAGFDYGFLDRSTTTYNAIQENLFHIGVAYVL